jgi:hypothetical protein
MVLQEAWSFFFGFTIRVSLYTSVQHLQNVYASLYGGKIIPRPYAVSRSSKETSLNMFTEKSIVCFYIAFCFALVRVYSQNSSTGKALSKSIHPFKGLFSPA